MHEGPDHELGYVVGGHATLIEVVGHRKVRLTLAFEELDELRGHEVHDLYRLVAHRTARMV